MQRISLLKYLRHSAGSEVKESRPGYAVTGWSVIKKSVAKLVLTGALNAPTMAATEPSLDNSP